MPNSKNEIVTCQELERLDKLLSSSLPDISRSMAAKLIKEGCITLESGVVLSDGSHKIKPGEIILVRIPEVKPLEIKAVDIPLDIVFEDEHLLVINKPAGLTVHPAAGHSDDTMVNALLAHCGDTLSGINGVMRPGIVHRLDKDTSGLMLVAKNDKAHKSLAAQLEDKSLARTYVAFCLGSPRVLKGRIESLIGRHPIHRQKMAIVEKNGKNAVTNYVVKKIFGNGLFSEIECKLETGRTHQIRLHMGHLGCPLVGDQTYGNKAKKNFKNIATEKLEYIWSFPRQALHAKEIGFVHPATKKAMRFTCELPSDIKRLEEVLAGLENL